MGILFGCGEDEEDEPEKTVELSHHPQPSGRAFLCYTEFGAEDTSLVQSEEGNCSEIIFIMLLKYNLAYL